MLLPLLIPILCALLFIIFYKRPVNTNAVHGGWVVPIDPPTPKATQPGAEVAPVAPPAPAPAPVSMNFNDIFAAKKPPTDRPSV